MTVTFRQGPLAVGQQALVSAFLIQPLDRRHPRRHRQRQSHEDSQAFH